MFVLVAVPITLSCFHAVLECLPASPSPYQSLSFRPLSCCVQVMAYHLDSFWVDIGGSIGVRRVGQDGCRGN